MARNQTYDALIRQVTAFSILPGRMMVLALFNLERGEILLILSLVLILVFARKIPELMEGFKDGLDRFRDATRDVADEVRDQAGMEPAAHNGKISGVSFFLAALTFILGAACLVFVLYELAK